MAREGIFYVHGLEADSTSGCKSQDSKMLDLGFEHHLRVSQGSDGPRPSRQAEPASFRIFMVKRPTDMGHQQCAILRSCCVIAQCLGFGKKEERLQEEKQTC